MAKSITSQLIDAITKASEHGVTRYRIAKETGISEGQLSRLMHGTVAPRLDTAERIAKVLGYDIKLVPKKNA